MRALCVCSHLVKLVYEFRFAWKNARIPFFFLPPNLNMRVCITIYSIYFVNISQDTQVARICVFFEKCFHLLVFIIAISICLFTKYYTRLSLLKCLFSLYKFGIEHPFYRSLAKSIKYTYIYTYV